MTDFVLQQEKIIKSGYRYYQNTTTYAEFLKQPITLGMFVPCDEDGDVVYDIDYCFKNKVNYCRDTYEEAKERVLFEGFDFTEVGLYSSPINWISSSKYENIEDLIKHDLILTPSAIKKLIL